MRTNILEIFIVYHLIPQGDPSSCTCQRKNTGKHICWDTNRTLYDSGVEINVGVQATLDKVIMFESNTLKFHGQLEQWIVFYTQGLENLFTCFLHELGACVIVFINTVTRTHQTV